MLVERAVAWEFLYVNILPVFKHGASDRDLPCCKASLLFFLLTVFAASDINWRSEIIHATNAVGICKVILWRANLSHEQVDPVSLTVMNTKSGNILVYPHINCYLEDLTYYSAH
jgi:hypothetical protein